MIRFQPASIPWLLAHELRLTWRGFVSGRKSRGPVSMIALAVLVVMALIAGVSIALAVHGRQIPVIPLSIAIGDFVLAVILTLMLSTGLAAAADVLYERGDLDLLFSSPIAPRKVLFVRALGVAVNKLVNGRIIEKRIHIRTEHVRKSKCREDFLTRVKKNDNLKREAKAKGEIIDLRRKAVQPKEAEVIKPENIIYQNSKLFKELF